MTAFFAKNAGEKTLIFEKINERWCCVCGHFRATHLIISEDIFNHEDIHHYREFYCERCYILSR